MNSSQRRKIGMGKSLITLLVFFAFNFSPYGVAQTGGTFDLSHSVIAGGGTSNLTGDALSVDVTIGQAAAGTISTGSTFIVHGGFWFQDQRPTAATVSITGRAVTAEGRGIRNAVLTLTNSSGESRTAITGPKGNYTFADVPAGETYVISIRSRRFQFANPTQVITLADDLNDLDFAALPSN